MQTKTKGIYGKTQEFRPVFRCWAFMDGDARIFTRMVNNHCTMRTLRPLVRFCFALWPILHCGTACFAVRNGRFHSSKRQVSIITLIFNDLCFCRHHSPLWSKNYKQGVDDGQARVMLSQARVKLAYK